MAKEENREKKRLNYDVKLKKKWYLDEKEHGNTRSINKAKLDYEDAKKKRDRNLGLK